MRPLSILIADDHVLVRSGLKALLSQLPNVSVIAEAGDGPEALRLMEKVRPDIALLDISMPGLNGIDVTMRAVESAPGHALLFFRCMPTGNMSSML